MVSVIIPTYNRAAYLGEAITSVLDQDWNALELIVIDDGSSDATPDILRGLPEGVRWLRQDNRGIGAARNVGIGLATGEFLAFLDSDDRWCPDKLSRQLGVFEQAPETDAVYGQAEQFISPELTGTERARLQHLDKRVVPAPIASSLLIRRSAFNLVGPFDESFQIGVDMDWYARLCERGLRVVMLDQVVYRRRLHRTNLNLTHAHEQSERLQVLKRALDRRRGRAIAPPPDKGCDR